MPRLNSSSRQMCDSLRRRGAASKGARPDSYFSLASRVKTLPLVTGLFVFGTGAVWYAWPSPKRIPARRLSRCCSLRRSLAKSGCPCWFRAWSVRNEAGHGMTRHTKWEMKQVSPDCPCKRRLMVEEGRRVRHTLSQPDLNIAATAACHGLSVVAHDAREFEHARVPVVNPWLARA